MVADVSSSVNLRRHHTLYLSRFGSCTLSVGKMGAELTNKFTAPKKKTTDDDELNYANAKKRAMSGRVKVRVQSPKSMRNETTYKQSSIYSVVVGGGYMLIC